MFTEWLKDGGPAGFPESQEDQAEGGAKNIQEVDQMVTKVHSNVESLCFLHIWFRFS